MWDALMVALYSEIAPKFQVCSDNVFIFVGFLSMTVQSHFGVLHFTQLWKVDVQYLVFRFRPIFIIE